MKLNSKIGEQERIRSKNATCDNLRSVAKIGGDVDGAAGAERLADGARLLGGLEPDCGAQIGDPDPPLVGSDQHLNEVARGESPAARDNAPPLAVWSRHLLRCCRGVWTGGGGRDSREGGVVVVIYKRVVIGSDVRGSRGFLFKPVVESVQKFIKIRWCTC